jgi:uncharacterized membrane protein YdjX (TVP38/TMEM64 family)
MESKELSFKLALTICLVLFGISSICMYNVYSHLPDFTPEEKPAVKLPRNIEDAKSLGKVIFNYRDTHYWPVLFAWLCAYVFMQTFSIPGSTFCSILAGFMWPWYQALPLICVASGTGATLCYMLSQIVGQPLIKRFAPAKAEEWKKKVEENKDDLFNYILFLRITPFLPNWFINLTGPLVGVPLSPFFWGSVIGVAPLSMLAVQAGQVLEQLTSANDTLTFKSVGFVGLMALLSILPVYHKRRQAAANEEAKKIK